MPRFPVPPAVPATVAGFVLAGFALAACTGLTAGRETSARLTAPASRDSAWARVKRAMQAEVFTIESQDSLAGEIGGTRYPSPNTTTGSGLACRLRVSLALAPASGDSTEISGRGLWTVYKAGRDSGRAVGPCDQELAQTMARLQQAAAPPTP